MLKRQKDISIITLRSAEGTKGNGKPFTFDPLQALVQKSPLELNYVLEYGLIKHELPVALLVAFLRAKSEKS